MTTEKNIQFSFRNKFEKLLNDGNRQNIVFVFQKFCGLYPDKAIRFLWRLSTSNEERCSTLLDKFGLLRDTIPTEAVPVLRNELRYQYETLYPHSLTATVPEVCQKAFDALTSAMGSVSATVVYQHCQEYGGDAERVLYLLQSDLERFYYGGILELYFNRFEAVYLVPFRMKIYDLLKAVCDYQQESDSGCDDINLPFSDLANLIQEAGIKLADDVQEVATSEGEEEMPSEGTLVEEPTQENGHEFTPLTSEEVLKNKEVFRHFVTSGDANVLILISTLGFDLNEVIARREQIANLLMVHETMEEAQNNWSEAKAALEKAQGDFAGATQMFDRKE